MPTECSLLNQTQCYGNKCIFSNGVCRAKQCQDFKGDISESNCEAFIEGTVQILNQFYYKKCMRGPFLIPNGCVDKVDLCSKITSEYQCNDAKDSNNNKCKWMFQYCIQQNQNIINKVGGVCPVGSTSHPVGQTSPQSNFCLQDKKCTDTGIATVEYTDEICENYLISCKKDTTSACKTKTDLITIGCGYYVSKTNCVIQTNCYWSITNVCISIKSECSLLTDKDDCDGNKDVSGTFCKWNATTSACQNICETLATGVDSKCSTLDSKCVLNGTITTQCIKKKSICSDYIISKAECEDDDRCRYNSSNKCVDRQCTDLTDNRTHQECNTYKSECTKAYPGGCSILQPNCSDYKVQRQCNLNDKSKICYWSESRGCIEKKCSEIDYDNVKPKTQCLTFYTDLVCNINNLEDDCEDLRDSCNKYN